MTHEPTPWIERNKGPILERLREHVEAGATVIEFASGTGEHCAYLAPELGVASWQPTEPNVERHARIRDESQHVPAILPPVALDVIADDPPLHDADFAFCANMIHIAPREATEGLLRCVASALTSGGRFAIYGPFQMGGGFLVESNASFDLWLKEKDPRFGVRHLEWLVSLAASRGLMWESTHAMPANNHLVWFRRI